LPCALYTEGSDCKSYIPYLKHIEVHFLFISDRFNFITEVGQRLPDNNWRILLDVYFALWHFWSRMVTVQSVCKLTKLRGFHGNDVTYYILLECDNICLLAEDGGITFLHNLCAQSPD